MKVFAIALVNKTRESVTPECPVEYSPGLHILPSPVCRMMWLSFYYGITFGCLRDLSGYHSILAFFLCLGVSGVNHLKEWDSSSFAKDTWLTG